MNKKLIIFFILFYFFIVNSLNAEQPKISVSGGWFLNINELNLTSGAGSDLKNTYISLPDATVIDISASPKTLWTVYARITAVPNSLIISVRRTSNGEGTGWIEGGEHFIRLSESYTKLFSGKGSRNGITLQYKLSGISIKTPPGFKSININFIVEEENP